MAKTHIKFVQHDQANQYTPGACTCFHCTALSPILECNADSNQIRDWNIGMRSCCSTWCANQNVCVPVNDGICRTPSFTNAKWDKRAPNVKCFYDVAKLQGSVDEINTLVERFGIDQQMMWDVCKHPETRNGKKYNPIHASGRKGDLCRVWWHRRTSVDKTKFIREYCVSHPDSQDCRCANRNTDPIYREIKKVNAVNDGCWYAPCADTTNQFVEDNLINSKCPTILCSSFVNIIGNKGNVSIENFNASIICGEKQDSEAEPIPSDVAHLDFIILVVIAAALTVILSLIM